MERDEAPDTHRLRWHTGAAARLVSLAGRVRAQTRMRAATQRCNGGCSSSWPSDFR